MMAALPLRRAASEEGGTAGRGRIRRTISGWLHGGGRAAQHAPGAPGSELPTGDPRADYAKWFSAQHHPAAQAKPPRHSQASSSAAPHPHPPPSSTAHVYPPHWGAQQVEAAERVTRILQRERRTHGDGAPPLAPGPPPTTPPPLLLQPAWGRDSAAPVTHSSSAQPPRGPSALQEEEPLFGEGMGAMRSPSSGAQERWQHVMVTAAQLTETPGAATPTGDAAPPLPPATGGAQAEGARPHHPPLASRPSAPPPSATSASILEASGGVLQWDPARNSVFEALYIRLCRAIEQGEDFTVTVLLPLHPDGPVRTSRAIQLVLHWEQCTIAKGPHSLLGRLGTKYPGVDLTRYVNFVALRNHARMPSGGWATEIVYVHSKIMVVDDRVVIIGSANINDRSQYGDRDSEVALLVSGGDRVMTRLAGRPWKASAFAHTLRRNLMEEHLGLAHTCAMFSLGSKDGGSRHALSGRPPVPAGAGATGLPLPLFRVDNSHACGAPMRLVAPTNEHRAAARMPARETGGAAAVSEGYAGAPYNVQTEQSKASGLGGSVRGRGRGLESGRGGGEAGQHSGQEEQGQGHAPRAPTAHARAAKGGRVAPTPPPTPPRQLLLIPLGRGGDVDVTALPSSSSHAPMGVEEAAARASATSGSAWVAGQATEEEEGEGEAAERGEERGEDPTTLSPRGRTLYDAALQGKDAVMTAVAALEGTAGCEPVHVFQARRRLAAGWDDGPTLAAAGGGANVLPVPGDACALDALLDPADPDGAYRHIWIAAASNNARIYGSVFPGAIQDGISTLAEWREREASPPLHPSLLDGLVGKVVVWPSQFLHGESLAAKPGEVEYLLPSKVTQ